MTHGVIASSAVIGLREALEVALITGILLAVMKRKGIGGPRNLITPLVLATATGFVVGAVAYRVVESLGERWYVEAGSYLAAAVIVLWVVSWSRRGASEDISKANSAGSAKIVSALLFVFTLREALEVALMSLPLLAADVFYTMIGLTIGILGASAVALALYKIQC
ncbi:MAG: FTR1 family protein [Desulfurococcales archaeon]|nr:FTR1 family protein [Desulfurococcales archaeon]